ncbi:hypothetical protein Tco_0033390 [Tanacetum coccineum]
MSSRFPSHFNNTPAVFRCFIILHPRCKYRNAHKLHVQTDLIKAMQNFLKKYDHIPHNEKSIKLLLAEEKFMKIKQVVEEEQTQPEYLQEFSSLFKTAEITIS